MKNIRKLLSILLLFALCISAFTINTSAALPEEDTIEPLYTNIGTISLGMTFNNGMGNATGAATKKAGVTKVEGYLYIYKDVNGERVHVGTWTGEITRTYTLAVSADFEAEQGVTYYASFTVIAESSTIIESDTVDTSKTYN